MSTDNTTDRYQATYHGKQFFVHGNNPDDIDILDIVHALSHVNRFNGHTNRPYSVAEHSILVMDIVRHLYGTDPHLQFAALMHDASEYVLGDIASPLKATLPDYQALEAKVMARIGDKFGFDLDKYHDKVKHADWVALFAEAIELQPAGGHREWAGWERYGEEAVAYRKIFGVPWYTPVQARKYFLREFARLSMEINMRACSFRVNKATA